MALDKDYFDAIHIDVVKKKYYNANKVNALLEDICTQAQALEEENQRLKAQLEEISQHKDEIGDTLLTAQAAARDIIAKAKTQAGRVLADAQRQREEILSGAADQQEYAAACVERTFDKLKRQQMENIDTLNGLWQEFLCGLMSGTEQPVAPVTVPVLTTETEPIVEKTPEEVPEEPGRIRINELETMVNNIARELSEIMGTAE